MKYKSTVAQAVFDEAMAIVEKSDADLRTILPMCKTFPEYGAVMGVISERHLNGFLAAAKVASEVEMQCAGMVAIVSANCGKKE
ncbi:MAG: hypothetical protein PHX83_07080 [Acidobacteriia bacterium]|nr:hypothetical protein [Terriglobia bacterium]